MVNNQYSTTYEPIITEIDVKCVSEFPISWSPNSNIIKYAEDYYKKDGDSVLGFCCTGYCAVENDKTKTNNIFSCGISNDNFLYAK